MKLKRFLLRYNPPGVGLEVENGSTVDVVHEDLPPQGDVTSSQAIRELVDQMIASQPELLTKQKHSKALAQLLSRLYQIELEEENVRSPAGGDAAPLSPVPVPTVQEGQEVVVVGLKGKMQVYNGELGTVAKVRSDRDKYDVAFVNPDLATVKVKGSEHVIPVAKGALVIGTHVAIRGLRNHIELNGILGRIVECHEESHRFEVRALANGDAGQLFRVKQENLLPVDPAFIQASHKETHEPHAGATPRTKKEVGDNVGVASLASLGAGHGAVEADGHGAAEMIFEVGAAVQLMALKTAMQYNGQQAEVLSVDRARGRYEIRLHDGSVKTIRAENVRAMHKEPPKSPRLHKQKKEAREAKPGSGRGPKT